VESIESGYFEEEAFGRGRVCVWDEGKVDIAVTSSKHLMLVFSGKKMSGKYEFRRMLWYPGNRWLLIKLGKPDAQRSQILGVSDP
jgi:hypothetical protein